MSGIKFKGISGYDFLLKKYAAGLITVSVSRNHPELVAALKNTLDVKSVVEIGIGQTSWNATAVRGIKDTAGYAYVVRVENEGEAIISYTDENGDAASTVVKTGNAFVCINHGATWAESKWLFVSDDEVVVAVENKGATFGWGQTVTVATVQGKNITIAAPADPAVGDVAQVTYDSNNVLQTISGSTKKYLKLPEIYVKAERSDGNARGIYVRWWDNTGTEHNRTVATLETLQEVFGISDIEDAIEAIQLGAVYDVSAKNPTAGPNNDGKFESLSALLSDANLSTLIPTSVRKGGMSIKFVQSSDNKYIQARCMAQNFTTDVTQWQGVEDEPTVDSKNLVSSSGIKTNLLELCYRSKEKKASQSLFTSGSQLDIVEIQSSTDIKGVTCEVVAGQKYHIKKSEVTDSFIVCIMTTPPNEWEDSMKQSYPLFQEVNGETTEIDIVSPSNGWMLIGYTHSGESCEITVNSEDFYVLDRCTCYESNYVCNAAGTKLIKTAAITPLSTSRGFYFPCKAGKTYVVVKSKASNRFRVTFITTAPADWENDLKPEIPKIVNYDDSDKLEFEFNAPNDGYIIICTTNSLNEIINLLVFEVTNIIQPKILNDRYVLREMPINPEWNKWDDIRYYWGFDINTQRVFNTIKGVLESDTMLSVRGGKGRWSGSTDFHGGHVFEGWSKNELFRLTMVMGKFKESFACIQTYSPRGLYETNRRFGWVKIGSDEQTEGVDFGKSNTIFYTPLTLQSRASAPVSVPDYDLHPVLSDNTIPDGTMYYDTTLNKVRVKVNGVWKNVMLES